MAKLVAGMKVRYLPQPEWGVGHLLALLDSGNKAQVLFPAREGGPVIVSTKGGTLEPFAFGPGDRVTTAKGKAAVVTAEVPGGRGLRRYVFEYEDGEEDEAPESELRATAPKPDLLSMLKEGRVADAAAFRLRQQALLLDDERRCDALGALFASRVMVKPHQVGVVQRVLAARSPRFILADEVGLGKTIEAGMVFSALRLAGLANRALVVAPSHLAVQWLAELFHKFNQLFTFMDQERYLASKKERPDVSPWVRFPRIVTSLEFLARSPEHVAECSDEGAFWDLVVMDEAHHLKAEKAFAAARALSANTWGLLLLTATPLQLDPEEYCGLLTLVDPKTAPTPKGFGRRMEKQAKLSGWTRQLLEKRNTKAALRALAEEFPEDPVLAEKSSPEEALAHLSETYSLSERLIRNRRVVVGGFGARRLHRHRVVPSAEELGARRRALDELGTQGKLRGAALAGLLRRLESSPAAFDEALAQNRQLEELRRGVKSWKGDAKLSAFLELVARIGKDEPGAKVLVFTESRATLEWLRERLRAERQEALVYHGDLALVERDRQVARFRDPDGPRILLSTEVGGEGRNFQFAHHLIHYDLPWSPAVVEQRIGRLDRIGQRQTVELHAFEVEGTFSAHVLALLADSVRVFEETVGGLDSVLEEVEPRLVELALQPDAERAAYARTLGAKVTAAREEVRRSWDPLLDLRSFDREALQTLARRAQQRLGMEEELGQGSLEDQMLAISRDLDERLEDTVTELARKVGIGVDTDEEVEAFQCAFHFGHELKVEALPGLPTGEDRVMVGSFWRDTAVEAEEVDYFTTGHSLVEALFAFLRDGPFGRNGFRYFERRGPLKARGAEFLFHVVPPEAADTSPGARVPSRQLSRFVERWLIRVAVSQGPDGAPKVDPSLLSILEGEGRSLKGDEIRAAFAAFSSFVEPALVAARREADAELQKLRQRARAAIETERDRALERLGLALVHQGLSEPARQAELASEKQHYQALLEALSRLDVVLDSAAGFVINR